NVSEVYADRLDGMWPEVRDALRAARDEVGTIRRVETTPDELALRISRPEGMGRALEIVRGLARPVVTLTGAGASDIVVAADGDMITVRLTEAEQAATDDRTMQQSVEIIRRRVDEVGTREPTIQRQ